MDDKINRPQLKLVKSEKHKKEHVKCEGFPLSDSIDSQTGLRDGKKYSLNWTSLEKLIQVRDQIQAHTYIINSEEHEQFITDHAAGVMFRQERLIDEAMAAICAVINDAKPLPELKL
jgi:hypothetical protein